LVIDEGTLTLGENLSVRSAEQALDGLATLDKSGRIEIDLSELAHVELGAGWRLGNALSAWSREAEVTVRVPPVKDFSGNWFKHFTRSGLGLALGTHPVTVEADGRDVTESVRAYYRGLGALMANANNVVVAALERRVDLRHANVFAEEFTHWAPYVGLEHIDSSSKALRIPFLSMIREAISNVQDHAYRRPCPQLESRLSYASLRRYAKITSADGNRGMERYLRAVDIPADTEQLGWVEIVVVDDGCGIATRHSQDPGVCSGDAAAEDEALTDALTSGVSVKPRTRDAPAIGDPGYGFTYIAAGLRRYQAYAELRTGRRLLTLDASGEDCDGFVISEQALGWMPGTAMHVVFPLNSPQLRIHL